MKKIAILLILMTPFKTGTPGRTIQDTEVRFKVEKKLEDLNRDIQEMIYQVENM